MTPIPDNRRTTDPILVNRVRDWHDSEAWSRFVSQYDRHLLAVCTRYGLQGDAADECCQQVWIQLAAAMQNFPYDPGRRFRGWLHLFFHYTTVYRSYKRVTQMIEQERHRQSALSEQKCAP